MSGVSNWKELERRISGTVKLARRPVAVTFGDALPNGIAEILVAILLLVWAATPGESASEVLS